MSVTAYCGFPGSGKTYEVVTNVIMPAVGKGRRIITNVHGIRESEIHRELVSSGVHIPSLGTIVEVTSDEVSADGFFMTEASDAAFKQLNEDQQRELYRTAKHMLPGDLVVIDEAWKWLSDRSPLSKEAQKRCFEACRFHRHCVNPLTAIASDIVLISQSMNDFSRQYKVVIEAQYIMRKLKALGLNSAYTVTIREGYATRPSETDRVLKRKYKPRYFKLYSSYQGKGEEKGTDARRSIFSGWMWKFGVPVVVSLGVYAAYQTWRIFHPEKTPQELAAIEAAKAEKEGKKAPPTNSSVVSQVISAVEAPPVKIAVDWGLVGFVRAHGANIAVLRSNEGSYRYVYDAPRVRELALDSSVGISEGFVTPWRVVREQSSLAGFGAFGTDPRALAASRPSGPAVLSGAAAAPQSMGARPGVATVVASGRPPRADQAP